MSEAIRNILIFDYDGTLTVDTNEVPKITKNALSEMKRADLATLGIISGRDLPFLQRVNEELSNVFSFLVAENGAISYFCDIKQKTVLGKEWSAQARNVL